MIFIYEFQGGLLDDNILTRDQLLHIKPVREWEGALPMIPGYNSPVFDGMRYVDSSGGIKMEQDFIGTELPDEYFGVIKYIAVNQNKVRNQDPLNRNKGGTLADEKIYGIGWSKII